MASPCPNPSPSPTLALALTLTLVLPCSPSPNPTTRCGCLMCLQKLATNLLAGWDLDQDGKVGVHETLPPAVALAL